MLTRPDQVETAVHAVAIHGLQFRLYHVAVPFRFLRSSQPFFDVMKEENGPAKRFEGGLEKRTIWWFASAYYLDQRLDFFYF